VSFECTPDLADDTAATIAQALELWSRLARPNVMIKVPATEAGIPAIEELTARGVNVNVTLLFSLARYEQVIDAYLTGLERRASAERAFADHGEVGPPIDLGARDAEDVLRRAEEAGIDLPGVTAELEREGVRSFCDFYHELLASIDTKLPRGGFAGVRNEAPRA
jgi:transaldolase